MVKWKICERRLKAKPREASVESCCFSEKIQTWHNMATAQTSEC